MGISYCLHSWCSVFTKRAVAVSGHFYRHHSHMYLLIYSCILVKKAKLSQAHIHICKPKTHLHTHTHSYIPRKQTERVVGGGGGAHRERERELTGDRAVTEVWIHNKLALLHQRHWLVHGLQGAGEELGVKLAGRVQLISNLPSEQLQLTYLYTVHRNI